MICKDERRLRVGVPGCGPIAQFAHFDSCAKARNAELHAICDVAGDLVARMASIWQPARSYGDYDAMLADRELEAVIMTTSDSYHLPAALLAFHTSKHVLCEKRIGGGGGGRRAAGGGRGYGRQAVAGRPYEALRSRVGGRPCLRYLADGH